MPNEGDKAQSRSGRPLVYQGGKWEYTDQAPKKRRGTHVPDAEDPWRNAKKTGQELLSGAQDFLIGAGTGLTMGFDDEIASAMGKDDYQKVKDESRARSAALADRVGEYMPSANTVGEVAGSVAGAKGAGAASSGLKASGNMAARVAGRGAAVAASAPVSGAVAGAGESNEDRVTGAVAGGAMGAAGGVVGKVLKGAARLGSGQTARVARQGADRARVQAAGLNPAAVAEQPGGISGQAATQRKYGVGKGWFDSRATQEDQVRKAIEGVERERGAIRQGAAGQRATGVDVGRNIAREARKLTAIDEGYRHQLLNKANDISADEIIGYGPGGMPVTRPRTLNIEELDRGRRHYSPDNWKGGPTDPDKVIAGAYSDATEDLLERANPGSGAQYRSLGRDEAGLIRAQRGVLGPDAGETPRIPGSRADAIRQGANMVVPRRALSNFGAHAQEANASAAEGVRDLTRKVGTAGPIVEGVDETMLQAGEAAGTVGGRAAGRQMAIDANENDPYEFYREYMRNPEYRHGQQ